MERTANDFVEDMLAHGRDWIAIMAVASAIRERKWYADAKTILQEKGLMPKDEAVIAKMKSSATKAPEEAPSKYARFMPIKIK